MPDHAHNVTPRQTPPTGYLSDPYDKTAVWNEQCAPLLEQVFAVCKEHDIPLFAVAMHQFERNAEGAGINASVSRAVHFPGPHRVPHQMAIVAKMYDDEEYCEFIIQMSQFFAASRFGGDVVGEMEA